MVWVRCQNCKGKMKVPDPRKPGTTMVCSACRGEGGANTKTTP